MRPTTHYASLTNELMFSIYNCSYPHFHYSSPSGGAFMPKPLTERQQAIYDFIAETNRSRGAPPTIREIMQVIDINSTNGVRTTLAALEKKGHIRRHARLSRGIELVDYVEPETLSADMREVPLIGRVAAGAPILDTQNIESTLNVDNSLDPA